jgi:hypothetical protein
MKNNNKQQATSDRLNLQTLTLDSEQEKLRTAQIDQAIKQFSEALIKDSFLTRDELANQVFDRLQIQSELNWQEHAQTCVAISDIRTRDGLLRIIHDHPEAREDLRAHLIREVARAQQEFVAPLATVFAGISWLDGHHEVTRLAVDRALEVDPAYSLAQLLDIALRHNVPASVWSSSLAAVSFDACLKGAA